MQPHSRRCDRCDRHRDADELFADDKSNVCLLCDNRKASFKAKAERTAARVRASQKLAAKRRRALSESERYRRQLQKDSPYSDAEIERFVSERFPDEART